MIIFNKLAMSKLFKINLLTKKQNKWKLFNRIYYLRKYAMYSGFQFYIEKTLNCSSYFFGLSKSEVDPNNKTHKDYNSFGNDNNYVLNYKDNYYNITKNLRYEFKIIFLKKSKKHKKIRSFLFSKKIISHPSILNITDFNIKRTNEFFLHRKIHLVRSAIFEYTKIFIKKLKKKFKKMIKGKDIIKIFNVLALHYPTFFEHDITAGYYINLRAHHNGKTILYWATYVFFLCWRFFAT